MKQILYFLFFLFLFSCVRSTKSPLPFPQLPQQDFPTQPNTRNDSIFITISQYHQDSLELQLQRLGDTSWCSSCIDSVHIDANFTPTLELFTQINSSVIYTPIVVVANLDRSLHYHRIQNIFQCIGWAQLNDRAIRFNTTSGNIKYKVLSPWYLVWVENGKIRSELRLPNGETVESDTLLDRNILLHSIHNGKVQSLSYPDSLPVDLGEVYQTIPNWYHFYSLSDTNSYQDFLHLVEQIFHVVDTSRTRLKINDPELTAKQLRKRIPFRLIPFAAGNTFN